MYSVIEIFKNKKILRLSLKKQWFDLIKSGTKTEEYREIKSYWVRRLMKFKWHEYDGFPPLETIANKTLEWGKFPTDMEARQYDIVEFTLGYPSKDDMTRRIKFKINDIIVGRGNTDWGAPNDKYVFIIKLGNKVV